MECEDVGQMSLEEFWSLEVKASKETNQNLLSPRGFLQETLFIWGCLVIQIYIPFIPSLQGKGESYPQIQSIYGAFSCFCY